MKTMLQACSAIGLAIGVVSNAYALPVALNSDVYIDGYACDGLNPPYEDHVQVGQWGVVDPLFTMLRPSFPHEPSFATGAIDAAWGDEAHGRVAFKNFGWESGFVPSSRLEAEVNGEWKYRFEADASGVLNLHFETHAAGSDLTGLGGFKIVMITESYGTSDHAMINSTGDFSYAITAGETAEIWIQSQNNTLFNQVMTPVDAHSDALFTWSIDAFPPPNVPEPGVAALVLLGVCIVAGGVVTSRIRRRSPD